MSTNPTLVFGSDPEVFAYYKKDEKPFVIPPAEFREKGLPIIIQNGKNPVFYADNDIKIIEDGVAFEFTIRPSTNWRELYERIQHAKQILKDKIIPILDEAEEDVSCLPTINYEVDRWGKKSRSFQNCLIFGCDPDRDAFNPSDEGTIINARKHPFRYGGGHLQVSGVPEFKDDIFYAVKCMAIGAGIAYVAYSDVPELEKMRTYLYGKPGKFRPQRYEGLFEGIPNTNFGIEYRTPSNSWTNNVKQAEQVFEWLQISIFNLFLGGLGKEILKEYEEEIKRIIVEADQKSAQQFLTFIKSKI